MTVFPSRPTRVLAAVLALLCGALAAPARAEGRIRISEQHGVTYMLLNIAQEQKLIEKYGKRAGVDIAVEWIKLSGGPAINDALLSGSIDIASAGLGPLLTMWDRTAGKQNVKGVASLGNFPYYLVSTNPKVKSLVDLTDKDRIAVPAVSVSVQSRILQMAVAKQWGEKEYGRYDRLTQSLPHPDAAAALIAGGTEISGHFGNSPYQEQELARNPNAHIILNSYEVQGGPSSSTLLYATEKFRNENPKTYRAFTAALVEAAQFASNNPEAAADIYLRVSKSGVDRNLLLKIIKNPQVEFKVGPQNTYGMAQFLHRIGVLKKQPANWREYFFEDPAITEGS
ncbi:ABC transporter substrate-binding protein [Janthinobacterium sp.]|uniref:ABC transporter substrate-binding protein n=1 Tax=Janthinobacterium sp. TaxID=1871054 RepID=UPI00293D2D27|nr:ABC transporter substrate-binding protein [Janthinobacterium sp.]